ncbi:hypothetical protein ACHAPJ_008805 [Fusarium lateritium]
MSTRKNVIVIGMTQNGKSSFVQQVLKYANEDKMARQVAIGQGNIAETQTCSQYIVDVPLKNHMLRQIDGGEEASNNGNYVRPIVDFDLDDVEEFKFGHDIEDTGETLPLRLIDTPGLSDSGNMKASNSELRVVDERHRLRILLTLQEIEQVHAICLVVKRDTNYGGDFQGLVKRMVSLLSFSVRSTAWNLQYHIIHTNIDVDDRASDTCQIRQQEFDKFGPPGAIHHFVDNTPVADFPLDVYFANHSLSMFFRSLSTVTPVSFSALHYAKSSEHVCNDQALANAVERAKAQLAVEIQDCREQITNLEKDITRYDSSAALNLKCVEEYETKIKGLDCDTHSEIDGGREEGWTSKNLGGRGERIFSFTTTVPIEHVEKSHDGDGDWEREIITPNTYQIILQPHRLYKAYGKVTLFAKKKDKHRAKIESLDSQMAPVKKRWQENVDGSTEATLEIARLGNQISDKEKAVEALSHDFGLIEQWGLSIPLSQDQKLIKYFTIDSPLATALGYKLDANVPWTVPPLDKLSRDSLRSRLDKEVAETQVKVSGQKSLLVVLSIKLSIARGVKDVMAQLKNPPLGTAKLESAVMLLDMWKTKSEKAGVAGLSELTSKLEHLKAKRGLITNPPGNKKLMQEVMEFWERMEALEQELLKSNASTFRGLQRAFWEHEAAQVARDYLDTNNGLLVGAFATLVRAGARGHSEPYLTVFSELKDILELGEMAFDE